VSRHPRHAGTTMPHLVDIVRVIRSRAGGSDEQRRGLCYDQHHVWAVTVTVTIPEKLLCVLRGGFIRKNVRIDHI
jgi:hypothetical protein